MRQLGNAVPVDLARVVAESIGDKIRLHAKQLSPSKAGCRRPWSIS
jgi:hypothetical protein